MYHGWSDPQVPPLATIAYFNAVLRATGASRRGTAIELYMQPGVNHCWGGDGPDTFDAVGALDQWVRTGQRRPRHHARCTLQKPASTARGRSVRTRRSHSAWHRKRRPGCKFPLRDRKTTGTTDQLRTTNRVAISQRWHRQESAPLNLQLFDLRATRCCAWRALHWGSCVRPRRVSW